ncbi:MAG: glycosyltransferase [Deltaproteobacteria bacterium]|nr:glycosyltransferase [Deltaproteobacteria bacterium]
MTVFLAIWMGLVALLWGAILLRARREVGDNPFRVGVDGPACAPELRVSVVVPARNEVRNIEGVVRSVLAQDHQELELVVLDAGSTDGTLEVLRAIRDPRLVVVEGGGEPLPEGWLGKPWACQRAAQRATGDWLLFVDADVRLAPEAVSRAVAYAQRAELGLMSGLGTVVNFTLAERVLQPAVTGLIIAGNDLREVNDPSRRDKALANGQFMLFSREGYLALGGHEAVRANVLDDVGMALAAKAAGVPFHLVFMRELFSVRMYESGAEVWAGWRKNLFAGVGRSWPRLLAVELGLLAFVVGPYAVLLSGLVEPLWGALALPAVLLIQGTRWVLDGVFHLNRWTGLWSHAVGYALVMVLMVDSAVSSVTGTAKWKGRALPKGS